MAWWDPPPPVEVCEERAECHVVEEGWSLCVGRQCPNWRFVGSAVDRSGKQHFGCMWHQAAVDERGVAMTYNRGTEEWDSTAHPPFINVYQSIGGWKPQLMVWVSYPATTGMYEPWQTGYGCRTRESAVLQGKAWAESEGIEFKE